MSVFERYLQKMDFKTFLGRLNLLYVETILENIQYFTEQEARRRDKIVESYFSEAGISTIVDDVAKKLQIPEGSTVLDVGAGTGFFTIRIAEKLSSLDLLFYALDITPNMLSVLAKKLAKSNSFRITPVLGLAERIHESLDNSRRVYKSLGVKLPLMFDAVFSILMLHHCKNPLEVFDSVKKTLKQGGKFVLVDLCKHEFKKFKEDLGDVHLGFELDYIKSELGKAFSIETVDRMPKACRCKESGRSADLFIAVAYA